MYRDGVTEADAVQKSIAALQNQSDAFMVGTGAGGSESSSPHPPVPNKKGGNEMEDIEREITELYNMSSDSEYKKGLFDALDIFKKHR